jgi:hypothetical protein
MNYRCRYCRDDIDYVSGSGVCEECSELKENEEELWDNYDKI